MAIATTSQITEVARLYTALFNRAPDSAGLSFWANALASGASLSTVTQGFLTAPEGAGNYPSFQTAEAFVTAFYAKVFGRNPDAAGLAFWVAALNNQGGAGSTAAKAALASQIINVVSTPLSAADAALPANAQSVTDRALFANKVEIGTYMATNSVVTLDNLPNLGLVTEVPSSIDSIKEGIFTGALTGTGNVLGTAGDNVFKAALVDVVKARTIDGAGGNDTLIVTGAGAVTATTFDAAKITNIETIKLEGVTTGAIVDAAKLVGVTSVVVGAGSSGTVALNNMTGKSVGLAGTTNTAVVTATYSATDTTAAIVLAGSDGGSITLAGAKLVSASVTGAGVATLTAQPALVKTVNVTSTGTGITLNTTAAALTTVDASTSTGAVTATLGAGTAYKGGSGVDTVILTAAPAASIDGGAGAADVIQVTGAVAINPFVTNFEILEAGAGATGSYDVSAFKGVSVNGAAGGAVTFANAAAGTGLTVKSVLAQDVVYTLANATGTTDTVSLTLTSAGAIGSATKAVSFAGIETINVVSTDTDAAKHVNTLKITADVATSLVVTGTAGVDFTNTSAVKLTSFDASANTGAVTFASTNVTAGAAVSIKGSLVGVNNLVGGATNDTIVGGAAADFLTAGTGIDVLTGGAGNDTFTLAKNTALSSLQFTTITDFAKGDILNLVDVINGAGATTTLTKLAVVGATQAQLTSLALVGDGATTGIASWFQTATDTFIVIDNTAGTAFGEGSDQVIKLTGLVDLTTASITSELLSFSTAV